MNKGRHWHVHIRQRDRAPRESDHYWTESFSGVKSILTTYGVDGSKIESAEFHWVYSCDGSICADWEHIQWDDDEYEPDEADGSSDEIGT